MNIGAWAKIGMTLDSSFYLKYLCLILNTLTRVWHLGTSFCTEIMKLSHKTAKLNILTHTRVRHGYTSPSNIRNINMMINISDDDKIISFY